MPLLTRVLNVSLMMPSGTVVIDASNEMHVKVKRCALAVQNTASVQLTNINTSLREQLLSQFSALQQASGARGQTQGPPYIEITIDAGYNNNQGSGGQASGALVFDGAVVKVTPGSGPPNVGFTIECSAQQYDRQQYQMDQAPPQTTFLNYVKWASKQMGLTADPICESQWNDYVITNPSVANDVVSKLLWDIQTVRPRVVAFIENQQLIVRDLNQVMSVSDIVQVTEFIGIPQWTEWGAEFQTLFDPRLHFPSAVQLNSVMNPSLNKQYVIYSLEYDLASRDTPFYIKCNAGLPG